MVQVNYIMIVFYHQTKILTNFFLVGKVQFQVSDYWNMRAPSPKYK